MAASISPSLHRRMKGLLVPYRFSCVVISFFFVCSVYGKAKKKEGAKGERLEERWSNKRNRISAHGGNQVEKWMDYMMDNDSTDR